jgi:hypothetical protein
VETSNHIKNRAYPKSLMSRKHKLTIMKKLIAVLITVLVFVSVAKLKAQNLDKFKSDLGKKSIMGKEIRIPYTDVISYYGYIKAGTAPDEEKGGKKYYYLYVWIPAVAPEIGIRMISPIPENMKPSGTDIISPTYEANAADKTSYFDTWISFDKAAGITSMDDIATKGKSASWNSIQQNDDSSEMPAQPSGSKYNSLMRMTSEVSDPLKALTVGLYRIGFTTYKTGDVNGGFLAQLAVPIKLPGVKVSNTLVGLTTK